ncbi:tyrosine-protein phosphatase non-receptor type 13 [Exaiptasia diaphana]|uniref:Tyrosine-protein phosphatase non-receptor type 13 n=1 Tax=Exaiptasia diaphana TaxID=2652724 RepID=A0A913XHS0_EXADI|nr:tyrosine-protein phosphatase non-receptor type 13 [Exaiptasia diaphana]
MPALIANTVTLEEVLEVRGGPLNEDELWSILAQSCQALYGVFVSGKARKRHFGTYTITPATILLCHTGKVKFSLDGDCPNDRSFTAPETYARKAFPSEAALEKICVYSLGMSLYHAAEFEVAVGKPISLHESLENILLTMCEDSAQARSGLIEVLQECQSRYMKKKYSDVVASLVESLLGDEIPDIELEDTGFDNEAFQNDTNGYSNVDGEIYPSSISPVLASPRHLPTPPPPQISTRGQPTSAELVGSNNRRLSTPSLRQGSTSPTRLNDSRNLPPSLEKYKSYLDESRSKRSMTASLNGLDQLDSKPPAKHQRMADIRHIPQYQEAPETREYNSHPLPKLPADLEPRLKVNGSRNGGDGLRRYSSVNSMTSNSSSTASGPRSSMFSDGRSSSAISLTQGSYALESYITDGYESEFNLNSLGSSVSRNRFRNERGPTSLRDQQYVSVSDLGRPPPGPNKHLPLVKQFKSLPDIGKELSTNEKDVSPAKTFFGPEFVMITEDPEKSIVNITPNAYLKKDAQKKGSSQNRKMVTVVALNGQKLQLMAEVSMTTKDLYEHVIKFLGITEKSFFGLAKLEDDEVIFLELDVKLSKYAPPKWKEPKGEIVEFILYFRVKFYVEHIALLSHLSSHHQFYLQLRKDILEGRLYCHEEAAFVLAGLALQAETGDYDESLDQEYFLVEHYLHPRIINKVSSEYAVSQLPEFHQNFVGLSEHQAELDFVKEAQQLPEYGIHFYKVQANKKSDAEKLYLGICVRGITVYESTGHIKSPIHKHSWPLTKKISFKKKKFFIEPRANPDGAKLTFYTNHYKKSKYLLSMCTAFHRFQMKMRTRLASIEHEVALDFAAEKQQQPSVDGPQKVSPYERTHPPPSYKQNSLDSPRNVLVRSISRDCSMEDLQKDTYREMSVDINHNVGNHGNGKTANRMLSTTSVHDETNYKHDEQPYVIDSTLNDPRKQEPNQQDDAKERLLPPQDLEVSKPRDVLASPEREIRVIKLRKEPFKGLGITVLGGENSRRLDLGIYVKAITEGGAAAKDGRLKAGGYM